MSLSILNDLWNGNLAPADYNCITEDETYKRVMTIVNKDTEELKAILTDAKQTEKLELLIQSLERLSEITESDAFAAGFKLGARLMIELYT
jgi:predicted lipoprotein